VLVANGNVALNGLFLLSALAPPLIVILGGWLFLRAGRRHDERERPPKGPSA